MKLINTTLALVLSGQTFARDPKPIPERFTTTTDDEGNLLCLYQRERVNDQRVIRCNRQLAKIQAICDAQEKRKWRRYCNAIPAKRDECDALSPIERNRYREMPCCRQPDGSIVRYKPNRGWTCTENGLERESESQPSASEAPATEAPATEAPATGAPTEEINVAPEEVQIWDNENFDLGDVFMSKPDPENPSQWWQDETHQILYTYGWDTRYPTGAGGRYGYERLSPDLIFDGKFGRDGLSYVENPSLGFEVPGSCYSNMHEKTSAILAPIRQQQKPIGAVLIYPTWLEFGSTALTKVYIHKNGIGPDVSDAVECVCTDCSYMAAYTAAIIAPYDPLEFICSEVVTSASAVQIQVENQPGQAPKYLTVSEVKFGATGAQLENARRMRPIRQGRNDLRPYSDISQAQVNWGQGVWGKGAYTTMLDPNNDDSWWILGGGSSRGPLNQAIGPAAEAVDGIFPGPESYETKTNFASNNHMEGQLVLPIDSSDDFDLVLVYPMFDTTNQANATYSRLRVFVHEAGNAYPEGPNTDQAVICRAREIYYESKIRHMFSNPLVFECDRTITSAKSIQIRQAQQIHPRVGKFLIGEVTVGNYN
jgi:hypothetical protein